MIFSTTPSSSMDDCLFIYQTLRSSIYSPRRISIPDDVVYKIFSMAGFNFSDDCSRRQIVRGTSNENSIYLTMIISDSRPMRSCIPLSCTFIVESHDQVLMYSFSFQVSYFSKCIPFLTRYQ
jgi:hypothetical protein